MSNLEEFGEEEEADGVKEVEVTEEDGDNNVDPPRTVQKSLRGGRTRRESTEGKKLV